MNKKYLLIAALLLITTAGLVWFLTRPKALPTVNHKVQNPLFQKAQTASIKYSGKTLEVPASLGYYKNEGPTLQETATQLATKLNLKQSAFSKNVWMSADNQKSLAVSTFNNLIEYKVEQDENTGSKPSLEISQPSAKTFLSQIGLNNFVNPVPTIIKYYAGEELAEVTPEEAEIIEMYFKQEIEGLPIALDLYTFTDVKVWTGNQNQVIKAAFPPQITTGTTQEKKSLISFETAVKLVENKKGEILEIATEEGKQNKLINLGDINLTTVTLEYRLSQKDSIFYPYYRFEGVSSTLEDKKPASVIIVLPATQ